MNDGAAGHPGEPSGGDADSFAERYRALEPDVARLCARMLGRGGAAEDAASEVFLRAHRAYESYDAERPFRPWLLGIAGHHCIDQLRRRGVEARLFGRGDFETDDLSDPGPSPLARLVRAEERRALLDAVDALALKYRLPLVLRYFGDLDYESIGSLLDVSRNQVGTLLFRARRQLREQLTRSGSRGGGA